MGHGPYRSSSARRRAWRTLASVVTLTASALVLVPASANATVIVEAHPGAAARAAALVERAGGTVETPLAILNGFTASLPEGAIDTLKRDPAIVAVTPDRPVALMHAVDGYDARREPGSMFNASRAIRAHELWEDGITGDGVGVALIDTGIAPVAGLNFAGKVVNGPDISFDSQQDNLRYLDLYGHGTHMAGIIAGRDANTRTLEELTSHDTFVGVAPDARLVNVKVANALGATDVSQVIAGIDWVVQHRNDPGLNIRVLNLSFGTDSIQDHLTDPLAHAAEVAWRNGIVVVAAAGNQGSDGLTQPATDPYVLAVGADDTKGTHDVDDDVIPDWSSRGDGVRNPDLVAPGKSVASLRVAGSYLDTTYPEGRAGTRMFKGSGTSQSAAVISGAAALLLEQRPGLSPDQVKALLTSTASSIPGAGAEAQGAGLVNVKRAANARTPTVTQTYQTSTGTGSLEGARGSSHVVDADGNVLSGEFDIFGNDWDSENWALQAGAGTSWSGGTWNGTSWSGSCWCGTSWSGTSWSGTSWSGTSWSGTSWYGTSWSDATWTGTSWSSADFSPPSGTSWSGSSWYGTSWYGTSWSGTSWSGTSWSGTSWSTEGWS